MTFRFLIGTVSLAALFVASVVVAVLRAKSSHGAPAMGDYWFGLALLAALTFGFLGALGFLVRSATVPVRVGSIAGVGAVTLLLVSMMLVGKPLGMRGSIAVAFAAGAVAALAIGGWQATRDRLGRASLAA